MRHTRALSLMVLAALSFVGCAGGLSGDRAATVVTTSTTACDLIAPAVVQDALGVTSAALVGGPTIERGGTCSWHSTDPVCSMRSLGVEVRRGDVVRRLLAARSGAADPIAVSGLGDEAFTSIDPLPLGAAVQIAHLDVRAGDTWTRFTLLGRINPDTASELLQRVAAPALVAGRFPSVTVVRRDDVVTAPDATSASGRPPLPDVMVTDVTTGEARRLRAAVSSARPTLLWLWSPECAACNDEAAAVAAFAFAHRGEIDVIGLGSGTDHSTGQSFIRRHHLEGLTMVWDDSGDAWVGLGVATLPGSVLVDSAGRVATSWIGGFAPNPVLKAVAAS